MDERGFVKVDPPMRVAIYPAGLAPGAAGEGAVAALHGAIRGLSPEGALVDVPGGPRQAGERLEIALELGDGVLSCEAEVVSPSSFAAGPAGPGGVPLRFLGLSEAARARLSSLLLRHRKADHIRICRDEDVAGEGVRTGFERYSLPHQALPEIDKERVDLRTRIFGKILAAPILISCMTGGSELARVVNSRLASAAQRLGLALGVGSQRAMLGAPELSDTYAVRDVAPDVLLFGNIGAVQLNCGVTQEDCLRLVAAIGADALAVHLNPLQEALQPEGETRFGGLKEKIAALAATLPVPVVLKEVGSGISREVARWVRRTSIAAVDVAGAGGTSFAKVEGYRASEPVLARLARSFAGWGIPTADSLVACRAELPDRLVFASGGVRDGIDAAKAIALGADLVGIARPFLQAATVSEEAVLQAGRFVVEGLRIAMFCSGVATLEELRSLKLERIG